MKKFGLIVFGAALVIGVIFAGGCGFGGFTNYKGIQGSGTVKSEARDVSGFTKIEASGAVNLDITAQKDFGVSVEADGNLLGHIKTEVDGDTLKIFPESGISTKNKINVKISMPEIKDLDVSGASTAVVSNISSDKLDLTASGASKIKIQGQAKDLSSDASGASGIDAENLTVENADIEASGASSATVSAANELKADASGASSIYYTVEPKNIKQNSSGASSVKKK
ncbi:MAG TPA: head GIN domain-containing protein [Pyrinomonadaceae bacterium]|nr:head GIN domain-containing protein [Pyrinomonadaceae bacterium]